LTLLIILYRDTSYGGTSNCMTKWFLSKEEESDEHVWAGSGFKDSGSYS